MREQRRRTYAPNADLLLRSAATARRKACEARLATRIRTGQARRRFGRNELKHFSDWTDGRPETELNFKSYRQATNKIDGLSTAAAAFLRGFF